MKKRIIATLAASILTLSALAGCAGGTGTGTATDSDYEYIKNNGKMVIGITEYQPMNYYDENGNLTGFDTEFAQAVCEKLGIQAEFQIIDWDTKETELKSSNIDCIWNGLTVTEERRENMDFTIPYLANKQCVVINSANADKYTDIESLSTALMSAESGSAGETAIQSATELASVSYTASASQADALLALNAGNYDAIVIDYTMAKASCGQGDYSDLMIVESIPMASELYAIGFRTGSDMTDHVNSAIRELVLDGTVKSIAEKYELTDLYEEAMRQQ